MILVNRGGLLGEGGTVVVLGPKPEVGNQIWAGGPPRK